MYLASSLEVNLSGTIRDIILVGAALLLVMLLFVWLHRHVSRPQPFYVIAATGCVVFVVITIGAIMLHSQSSSLGRMHRQANIEFWVCGTEISPLQQRTGLDNRLGNSTFYYRHADKQVTQSGYVLDELSDSSLAAFFAAIGGSIQSDNMILPISNDEADWLMPTEQQDGDPQGNMTSEFLSRYVQSGRRYALLELSDGLRCPDGSTGELQVFAYRIDHASQTYSQEKITQPDNFILEVSRQPQPDHCLVVEFSESRDRTNKLCQPIGMRDSLRCSEFGIDRLGEDTCYLEEKIAEGSN